MKRIKRHILATRPQFFPAVVLPVALGASTAWQVSRSFDLFRFLLTMAAAVLFHGGMNVLNDYFDHLNGTDNLNKSPLTPFTGGSRFIQRGEMTPGQTATLGAFLISAGSAVGLYLAWATTPFLLLIGAVGLVTGFFYSAPPLFFAGRGLGEAVVGLNFGLLTVLGSFMVQTGLFSPAPLAAALPLSFLISAILYINEFPDYEADRLAGKENLVVRLGPKRAVKGFYAIIGGAYLSIAAGSALGLTPPLSLIALFSAPAAIWSAMGLVKNFSGGRALLPSIKAALMAHSMAGVLLIAANLLQAP